VAAGGVNIGATVIRVWLFDLVESVVILSKFWLSEPVSYFVHLLCQGQLRWVLTTNWGGVSRFSSTSFVSDRNPGLKCTLGMPQISPLRVEGFKPRITNWTRGKTLVGMATNMRGPGPPVVLYYSLYMFILCMYTFHIFSWIPYITLHNPNCLIVCWLNRFVLLKGSLAPFVFWILDKTFHTSCINAYSLASYVVADVTHPHLSFLHVRKRKQTQMTRWLCFSPPARWGSLDFNKGAALPPPRLLRQLLVTVGTNGPEPYRKLRMQWGTTSIW